MIIDDEIGVCKALQFALKSEYDVSCFTDPVQALNTFRNGVFPLVLLDLKLGNVNGLDVLREIKAATPNTQVIMMTAYGNIRSSVNAIKGGAYTYLTKPVDMEELKVFMQQALALYKLAEDVHYLSETLAYESNFYRMVGSGPAMQKIYGMIDILKDTNVSVIITGESGTGKELVAQAIHYRGNRRKNRFIPINCAAIPEQMLEAEFFGYKKGAFTGAYADKQGKFSIANGGTIFLDEIGDMPLSLQSKLLRVLQEKQFTPLGSNETCSVDVRILAATNANLEELVEEKKFRGDLYYRLNVMQVTMPPLRERKEDIPELCAYFITRFNKEQSKHVRGLTDEALAILLDYDFPGNVRQLSNILEHSMILCRGDYIDENLLPREIRERSPIAAESSVKPSMNTAALSDAELFDALGTFSISALEDRVIQVAIERAGGKKAKAAELLGITERTLWNKLKKRNN